MKMADPSSSLCKRLRLRVCLMDEIHLFWMDSIIFLGFSYGFPILLGISHRFMAVTKQPLGTSFHDRRGLSRNGGATTTTHVFRHSPISFANHFG